MTAPINTDYDAAQALLDLQSPVKQENSGAHMWLASNQREEMEKTAKLFWNCFISSEIPEQQVSRNTCDEFEYKGEMVTGQDAVNSFAEYFESVFLSEPPSLSAETAERNAATDSRGSARISIDNVVSVTTPNRNETFASSRDKLNKESAKYSSNKLKRSLAQKLTLKNNYAITTQNHPLLHTIPTSNGKHTIATREIATQTEERYINPNIEFMEDTIKNLCEKIQSLEAQLKRSNLSDQHVGLASFNNEESQSYKYQQTMDISISEKGCEKTDKTNFKRYSKTIQFENPHVFAAEMDSKFKKKVTSNRHFNPRTNELVPIGDGNATVPARILKHINWNSYTSATRKLLTAVFSRRILATHSLTGKPSPAFPNKPAKKKLNPALVQDIVQTVAERCSVPENVVRTSITTKCADESKMFKTRQSFKIKRNSRKHSENIPPTTSESEAEDFTN